MMNCFVRDYVLRTGVFVSREPAINDCISITPAQTPYKIIR